jgi:hypothetical protein
MRCGWHQYCRGASMTERDYTVADYYEWTCQQGVAAHSDDPRQPSTLFDAWTQAGWEIMSVTPAFEVGHDIAVRVVMRRLVR